ncbi:hypothetical protein CTU88_30025 [Streptomyces sp. JV178]|nr:hypothetical protein CTU88_30025 [Streptomyces sp. JV178]
MSSEGASVSRAAPAADASPPAPGDSASRAPVGSAGRVTFRATQPSNTGRAPFSAATSSSASRTRQPRSTGALPADRWSAGKACPSVPAPAKTHSSKVPRAFSPTNRLFFPVRVTVTDRTRGSAEGPRTRPEPVASRTTQSSMLGVARSPTTRPAVPLPVTRQSRSTADVPVPQVIPARSASVTSHSSRTTVPVDSALMPLRPRSTDSPRTRAVAAASSWRPDRPQSLTRTPSTVSSARSVTRTPCSGVDPIRQAVSESRASSQACTALKPQPVTSVDARLTCARSPASRPLARLPCAEVPSADRRALPRATRQEPCGRSTWQSTRAARASSSALTPGPAPSRSRQPRRRTSPVPETATPSAPVRSTWQSASTTPPSAAVGRSGVASARGELPSTRTPSAPVPSSRQSSAVTAASSSTSSPLRPGPLIRQSSSSALARPRTRTPEPVT